MGVIFTYVLVSQLSKIEINAQKTEGSAAIHPFARKNPKNSGTGKVSGHVLDNPGGREAPGLFLRPFSNQFVYFQTAIGSPIKVCATTNVPDGTFPTCGEGLYTHKLEGPRSKVLFITDEEIYKNKISTEINEARITSEQKLYDKLKTHIPAELAEKWSSEMSSMHSPSAEGRLLKIIENYNREFKKTGKNLVNYEWRAPRGSYEFDGINAFYHVNFMNNRVNELWEGIAKKKEEAPYHFTKQMNIVITPLVYALKKTHGSSAFYNAAEDVMVMGRGASDVREVLYHEYGHAMHFDLWEDYSDDDNIYYRIRRLVPEGLFEGVAYYFGAMISNDAEQYNDVLCDKRYADCFALGDAIKLQTIIRQALAKKEDPNPHDLGRVYASAMWTFREDPEVLDSDADMIFLESLNHFLAYFEPVGDDPFGTNGNYVDYMAYVNSVLMADAILFPSSDNPEKGIHAQKIEEAFRKFGVSKQEPFMEFRPSHLPLPRRGFVGTEMHSSAGGNGPLVVIEMHSNAVNECNVKTKPVFLHESSLKLNHGLYCGLQVWEYPEDTDKSKLCFSVEYKEFGLAHDGECFFKGDETVGSKTAASLCHMFKNEEEENSLSGCRWYKNPLLPGD